jgi:cysteine synthase A
MDATEFVDQALSNTHEPVVIFALEWCEFCWSVRKFMASRDIAYQAIELDSVAYQEGMRGRRIRDDLERRTGMNTIPQIFIGGEFVGGCTDMFDGWINGSVQELLKKNHVAYKNDVVKEPYSFLPDWLQPR